MRGKPDLTEIEKELSALTDWPPALSDSPSDFGLKMLRLAQIQFDLLQRVIEWSKS